MADPSVRREISQLARGLIDATGAYGRLPTAVTDIMGAAGLAQLPSEAVFSRSRFIDPPPHFRKAISNLGKVQAFVDVREKEVFVHPDVRHEGQRRFVLLHEASHVVIPWQRELAYADDAGTLCAEVRGEFEREASFMAAELLFQGDYFAHIAHDSPPGFAAIRQLADLFGASLHATFRRFVETSRIPAAGAVFELPDPTVWGATYTRREAFASFGWLERFEHPSCWPRHASFVNLGFLSLASGLGREEREGLVSYEDLNGGTCTMNARVLSNGHRLFALLHALSVASGRVDPRR